MQEITAEEVLTFLSNYCVGQSQGMRAKDLIEAISKHHSSDSRERKLREIITMLRDEGYPICATPERGYWWAETPDEVMGICKWFHVRAVSSLRVISRLKKTLPRLTGQMAIPGINLSAASPKVKHKNYSRPVQISCVTHIPEELHGICREYVEQHQEMDFDKLCAAALASFLFQEGLLEAGNLYWEIVGEEEK